MENIKSAVLAACMVSAGVGMLSALSPGGALGRQMKWIVSLLFAVCLAVPLHNTELPTLDLLAEQEINAQNELAEEQLREQIMAETRKKLEYALKQALSEQGIRCDSLSAELHIDETGCIHISKVTAVCSDFAGANALLADLLGKEAEIVVTEVLS